MSGGRELEVSIRLDTINKQLKGIYQQEVILKKLLAEAMWRPIKENLRGQIDKSIEKRKGLQEEKAKLRMESEELKRGRRP